MSLQLDRYLQARASGAPVELACEQSGIGRGEAELWEADIASGEVNLADFNQEGEQSMANDNSTGDKLRLYIERVERLEEEKKGIGEDVTSVFNEAKSDGFDTKTMKRIIKLRKMEPQARKEAEALLETYMNALGMTPIEEAIALAVAA